MKPLAFPPFHFRTVFSCKLHFGTFTDWSTAMCIFLRLKCEHIIVYQHLKHYIDTYQWELRSKYRQCPLKNKWEYSEYLRIPSTTPLVLNAKSENSHILHTHEGTHKWSFLIK
jgi:hypothetical protein